MPYKKIKKQTLKRTRKQVNKNVLKLSKKVEQKKIMTARLMIINLKVDDYIYKNKPISTQEANVYAQEIETFRNQCCDQRYLQVIEKLSSYMKHFIKEQSPRDMLDQNIDSIVELNTGHVQDVSGPEYNAIDIEMERSISNLSIADPKDPLRISAINYNGQKKTFMENSTSTLSKETLHEIVHYKVTNIHKADKRAILKIDKTNTISQKQKDIVDDKSEHSHITPSSFEYDGNMNLGALLNDTNTKIKQTHEILEDTLNKTTSYSNIHFGNNNNLKTELGNQNADKQKDSKIIDNNSELSENLLSNFIILDNNTNPINNRPHYVDDIAKNTADSRNKVIVYTKTNTQNKNIKLNENLNAICSHNNKQSQNIKSCIQYGNNAVVCELKNKALHYTNETPKNIQNLTGNNNTELEEASNPTLIKQKAKGGDCNKLSTNVISNFQHGNYAAIGMIQHNTNPTNHQTEEMINTHYNSINNTISKSNHSQQMFVSSDLIRKKITTNPLQIQTNVVKKVKKQRNTVQKETTKTTKKRTYRRKNKLANVTGQNDLNKESIANTIVQGAPADPGNSVKKSIEKKKEGTDLSWVENLKFVRVIDTEEYTKFDNLGESFWSDLTLPPNIKADFEYDNINIWKT